MGRNETKIIEFQPYRDCQLAGNPSPISDTCVQAITPPESLAPPASPNNEPAEPVFLEPQLPVVDAAAQKRVEELNEKQLGVYAENYRLCLLMESGLTARQAKNRTGSQRSVRSVRDVFARFKKHGRKGLFDKRQSRKPAVVVLIAEVMNIVLAWYFARSAAGYRALAELSADSCRTKNLPVPSESSVKKFLSNLPPGVKLARKGPEGMKIYRQQMSSVMEQNRTTFSNELWQGDNTPPEIWVRKIVKGVWTAVPCYLTALLDDFSRAIPGFLVSTKYPDAWTISICSRIAMLKKDHPSATPSGIPIAIESDRGADYLSEAVQTSWQSLGINRVIDPPYYPNPKGSIERWFEYLDSNCLRKLPGHYASIGCTQGAAQKRVHELLTLPQLRDEITHWVFNVYHSNIHGETGRKPIELWEETVQYNPVEDEEELNILLLKYDRERVILNSGIRLIFGEKTNTQRHKYWSPQFDRLAKRKVKIRYNPEDSESILVYCAATGEFLCEAWDLRGENPKYTHLDVKAARRAEQKYLNSLRTRLIAYHKNVAVNDRIVEQEKEWIPARAAAALMPVPEKIRTAAEAANDDALEMAERFRQRNRRGGKTNAGSNAQNIKKGEI